MSSNLNKIFTSDAYLVEDKTYFAIFKEKNTEKFFKKDFVANFDKALRPCPPIPFNLRPDFCTKWKAS